MDFSSKCPEITAHIFKIKKINLQHKIYHLTVSMALKCPTKGLATIPVAQKLMLLGMSFVHACVSLAFQIARKSDMQKAWCTGNGHLLARRAMH